MDEEHWSHLDFTEIKPRRPEGQTDCESYWEPSTPLFSIWPEPSVRALEEDMSLDESELHYSDAGRMQRGIKKMRQEHSEFEFTSSVSAVGAMVERVYPSAGISPADELFFKGQLLPLHLPPRMQMVKKLSTDGEHVHDIATQEELPGRIQPLKYFVNPSESPDVNMSANSHGHHQRAVSWWDHPCRDLLMRDSVSSVSSLNSTERDSSASSGDTSTSSSRDSNGSSQDCFEQSSNRDNQSFQSVGGNNTKGSVFTTDEQHRAAPTWLRPPFKWKVLFGTSAKSKTAGSKSSFDSSSRVADVDKRHVNTGLSRVPECSIAFSDPAARCDCSEDLVSVSAHAGDFQAKTTPRGSLIFERGSIVTQSAVSPDQRVRGGADHSNTGIAKAKEYLNKYMKVLKPQNHVKKEGARTDSAPAGALQPQTTFNPHSFNSNNGPALTTRLPSTSLTFDKRPHVNARSIAISTSNRNFPAFSQSSRFSLPRDMSPRISSSLSTSVPRSNVNMPRRPVSTSSISEFQSAIQGAIAHCKESQSKQVSGTHARF